VIRVREGREAGEGRSEGVTTKNRVTYVPPGHIQGSTPPSVAAAPLQAYR